ncbi:13494_t:CDS:2, partial [Entrophospora sp. SA101]
INLEAERMGIINAISLPYNGELRVGDTITIQDIDLNDLGNVSHRITENIRGSFGGIVINERAPGIENLAEAIRQNNENPQQPFFIFQGTDLQDGEIIPVNIGHQTATYHLNRSMKINGDNMEAITFPGRQNFCSGTEFPFAPNDKGLNSLIGNETYLNKENLYVIVSREDFYDSLIIAGNFKVTNADGIRRFLENGANQFNYQSVPTISSTRNTRDSDGGEGLRRGQN